MTTKTLAPTLAEAIAEDTSWVWQDDMITFKDEDPGLEDEDFRSLMSSMVVSDDEGAAMSDIWGDDWNRDRPAQTRDELIAWLETCADDCSDD